MGANLRYTFSWPHDIYCLLRNKKYDTIEIGPIKLSKAA